MRGLRKLIFTIAILPALLNGQVKPYDGPYGERELSLTPPAPKYELLWFWAAHPEVEDYADLVPGKEELSNKQDEAEVDVFFVYPTIYTGKQKAAFPWFADVHDPKQNEKVGKSTIKYQASVFNGSAKVYAPLYRQAHYAVFGSDSTLKETALDFAYEDVKRPFEYYITNWNKDRPIIIAAHSQGTLHAARLLKDFFLDKPLMDKLVAAYLVGMPIPKDYFEDFEVCQSKNEIECWISWNTFKKGFKPANYDKWYQNAASVNPLTWRTDEKEAPRGINKGGIARNFKKIRPEFTNAMNYKGLLWIDKPHFFGNFLINWDSYHIADYNLFYVNIRENVKDRVESYLNASRQ